MSLDVNSTEPAYRLGRLLAVLESIQSQAQGQLNRNIINRFYGSASTRPGIVFPTLLRGAQHHLAKLPTGSRTHWSRELQAIADGISSFNPTLKLDEQGRFALGYYHQRQANFTKREKASENSESTTSEVTNSQGAAQ